MELDDWFCVKLRDWDYELDYVPAWSRDSFRGPSTAALHQPRGDQQDYGNGLLLLLHSKRLRHKKLKQETYWQNKKKTSFPMKAVGSVTQRSCAGSVLGSFQALIR